MQRSGLGFLASDYYAEGRGWNPGANYKQGSTLTQWAIRTWPNAPLVIAFEIPFANGRCEDILFDCVLGSADWRTGKLTTAQFIERGRRESAEYKKSVQEFLIYR